MSKKRDYQIKKFSPTRRILADYNDVAASLNRVVGLIEIDITEATNKIIEIEKKQNYKVSITGWVAKCVSQAVKENIHLNSFRRGRKLIVFDNVDISVIIEVTEKSGKKIPYNYVIRKAETKNVKNITDEIRAIQNRKINEIEQLTRESTKFTSLYTLLPRFFRRFVIRKIITNPFRLRKLIGTVGITSLGMFLKGQGGWALPYADKTLNIAIGGIKNNAILRNKELIEQKNLCLTVLIDHNIVDGAPAARFIARLSELMSSASYLYNLTKI